MIVRWFFVFALSLLLLACSGSSDNNNTQSSEGSSPVVGIKVTLSVPEFLMGGKDGTLTIYNEADQVVLNQVLPYSSQSVTAELDKGQAYRAFFNVGNNVIAIHCPLSQGCTDSDGKSYGYKETMSTRLSFAALFYPEVSTNVVISPLSQLVLEIVESDYVNNLSISSWMQANSVLANTLGMLRYQSIINGDLSTQDWNFQLRQAFNVALIFEQKNVLKANASSHLTTVARRLTQTLEQQNNRMGEFFAFIIDDAYHYLAQTLVGNSQESQDDEAKLKAYLLSKSLFPAKNFKPSPYLFESEIEQSKRFLDDYRSLLYTFVDDSPEYQQVVNATQSMNRFVTDLSDAVFTDLFGLFTDVLNLVPINSTTDQYQMGELSIAYDSDELSWQLVGNYKSLDLNLNIELESLQSSPFTGNRFIISANGILVSDATELALNKGQIEVFINPPEDPFGGKADGTGYVAIGSNIQVKKIDDVFTGNLDVKLTTHKQDKLIQNIEKLVIQGQLTNSGVEQDLSIVLLHPDVNSETDAALFSNRLITAVTYSAPIKGLGEPLLTLYLPYQDLSKGLNIRDLDIIAYFEGRLTKFIYSGSTRSFDYIGENQDGVSWNLEYRKKETAGAVYLNAVEQGHPRVVKNLSGIMFTDGNFISIF